MLQTKPNTASPLRWFWITVLVLVATVVLYLALHLPQGRFSFWEHREGIQAEVAFWALFGAFFNIILTDLTNRSRDNREASGNRLLPQLVQLLLSPALALLFYSLLYPGQSEEMNDKSFLAMSFIVGFFSGPMIAVLNIQTNEPSVPPGPEPATGVPVEVSLTPSDAPYGLLQDACVSVRLELDPSELFEDEKLEVLNKGLCHASVTVQSHEQGDIIAAEKKEEGNEIWYVADSLQPGLYCVRAMQSMRLSDHSILNLFGEEHITLEEGNQQLILPLRKLAT